VVGLGRNDHRALADGKLPRRRPARVQVDVVTVIPMPLRHARHRVALRVDERGEASEQEMPVAAKLFRGPAGEVQQRKHLRHLLGQPGDGFLVERAGFGDAGIPATPGVVNDPAAHERGQILAQQRGRTGEVALSQPVPDIRHAEIRRLPGERGQAILPQNLF